MVNKIRYYVTRNTIPYQNIAVEEYLMYHVQPGECILFLWQNRNTVVIGRNQNAWGECRVRELEESGGFLARRLSGGGAVYHDMGNLNFTFCVRTSDYDVNRQLSVIQNAVRAFGLNAEKTGRNDITVDGKKISGNAFFKSGDCQYHHGTILIQADTEKMSRYLQVSRSKLQSNGVASVHSRVMNLSEKNPEITVSSLIPQLIASFSQVYGLPPAEISERDLDWSEIEKRAAFFSSWQWRLGTRVNVQTAEETRFPWGSAAISYRLHDGALTDIRLFSDGLEETFLASLPGALEGCPGTSAALTQRAATIPVENAAQAEILRDCLQLLQKQLQTGCELESKKSEIKGTAAFYDKTAAQWAEKGYNSESELPSLLDFVTQFPRGSRFLDLCCGVGYESQRIHTLGYDVVGIDFSEESLKIAREKNPSLRFYHDNLLHDYSYIGKVDAVIVIAGLVHIETGQLKTAFRRMRDVLNQDGRLFITVRDGVGKIPERSLTTIDGEDYDRNFIAHTLEELIDASADGFSFEQEVGMDGTVWRNYIFRCK